MLGLLCADQQASPGKTFQFEESLLIVGMYECISHKQRVLLSRYLDTLDTTLRFREVGQVDQIEITDTGVCIVRLAVAAIDERASDIYRALADVLCVDESEGFYKETRNDDYAEKVFGVLIDRFSGLTGDKQ